MKKLKSNLSHHKTIQLKVEIANTSFGGEDERVRELTVILQE